MLARQLIREGVRNKYGKLIDKGILYKLLNNPVYISEAVHKGVSYPGEHIAIVDRRVWDKVQAQFQTNPRKRAGTARTQTPSLLKGLIFGPSGVAMSPSHTRKKGRLYRYYVSQTTLKQGAADCPIGRVPAAEIEKIAVDQVRILLRSPEIIVQIWRNARKSLEGLTETDVGAALLEFDPLWNELFPAEQTRIVRLLVDRVDVGINGVDIKLRIEGVSSLFSVRWPATPQLSGTPHDRHWPSVQDQLQQRRTYRDGPHSRHLPPTRRPEADPDTAWQGTLVAFGTHRPRRSLFRRYGNSSIPRYSHRSSTLHRASAHVG
jgi:hypothetical protein